MLPEGNMETGIFQHGSEFLPLKQIFLHRLNCKITFLPGPKFLLAGQIFPLRAPVFTMITEVLPRANRAVVTIILLS